MRLVKANEVQTLPRGRKATFKPELLAALKQIKGGNFGVLDDEFGSVEVDKRQAVAAEIRKHWKNLHGADSNVSIRWSPDGFAQVGAADKTK